MNRTARVAGLVAAATLLVAGAVVWADKDKNAAPNPPAIVSPNLQGHVNYLASPKMRGRGTGSKEIEKAATYIAAEFKKYGLEPAFAGSYYQSFTVTVGAVMGKGNSAAATLSTGTKPLALNRDFVPLNFSESGTASLPLVFAGYGITAEEHKFDEYTHLDVKDKAVIVLRHEPQENDESSAFAGKELTAYSQVVNKAINARNHGARAMILVNDPAPHAGEDDTFVKFGTLAGPENSGMLLIQASQAVVNQWLAPTGKTLADLQRAIDEKLVPQSQPVPGVELKLTVDVKRRTAPASNVVGILRGSDATLREEAVLVGAHYDHLGLGERNSLSPSSAGKIHAGADDNASGTAAMLEIARAMAAQKEQIKRSVIFMAFSAEEMGLLGSAHYTKAPAWPLEKTTAMVNLDMVGRPKDGKLTVGGVGTSPGFKALVEQANHTGLTLGWSQSGTGSSDHQSFYLKGVPVIFFFSGLHSDYHKPSDLPERILHAEHARVADLALRTAVSLTSMEARPQFVRVAEPARPITGTGTNTGYGSWFGSIPDMGEEVEGVKFSGVSEGSPAEKAGFKTGDILVEFAGKPIKNLYDMTFALRAHKPGEVVKVTVLRGGERVTKDVTLSRRN